MGWITVRGPKVFIIIVVAMLFKEVDSRQDVKEVVIIKESELFMEFTIITEARLPKEFDHVKDVNKAGVIILEFKFSRQQIVKN